MESSDYHRLGKELVQDITQLIDISTTATKKYVDNQVEKKRETEDFIPLSFAKKRIKLKFKRKKIFIILRIEWDI